MRLTWLAYTYLGFDGYGRYSARMIRALQRQGVEVHPHFTGAASAPSWLQARWGLTWDAPVITCLPPYYMHRLPKEAAGPHWLLTMTEGSDCPDMWAEYINRCRIDRLIVPCQWNADAFRAGGVECPISVIHGGTDPDEFPYVERERDPARPYTFLALADRGARKGWGEVYQAFYQAFGGKTTGNQAVRLLVKCRPHANPLVDLIMQATDRDPRVQFVTEDYDDMAELYAQVDVFAIPSRAEGWGMPHREAAMMGVPVITQRYSGMDDGNTDQWAIVVEGGRLEAIPPDGPHVKGQWRRVDVDELAGVMRRCYEEPQWATAQGVQAAAWLRANQTWDDAAKRLIALMQREGFFEGVYA